MTKPLGKHVVLALQDKSAESLEKISEKLYEYNKLIREAERVKESVQYHLQMLNEIREFTDEEPNFNIFTPRNGSIKSLDELNKHIETNVF